MTAVRERILRRGIEDEMRHSFLDYSMSVIVRRALPDVRDGLKPVHRRILLAMHGLGLRPERGYKKSATVVGEVLGKYHPHGDAAVYDALVRMVQDFSLRYPLVDGQGNFGSIDGDPAAAYRYTEARLSAAATELLAEIEKDTVAWEPNFDDRLEEPTVLPSRIPNLLVNGCSGIAVGMSTNVPPHNLAEVAAALRILIADPDCDASDLMRALPGPDFPTGGYIVGRKGIRSMYETGRGRMTVRARVVTEAVRGGRRQLVVTELPYAVSKSRIAAQIAGLSRKGAVPEVADLRDESDREGIRLVVELKRGADASRVMDLLFRRTALQSTFGAILLALDGGRQPEEMTLKTLLERYRDHRLEVVRRRSRHDLEKAESELHVAEGLLLALADVDEVVAIVRRSADRVRAIERLRARFGLSEVQAEAILRLRLARLTELEVDALVERRAELEAEIRELRGLLADESLQLDTVVRELDDAVRRHGDARRTEILDRKDGADFGYVAASVADEDVVVAFTRHGYLKRIPMHLYRRRTNAGLALTATERYPGDYLETVAVARTQGWLLGFTETGQVHCLRIEDVPEGARTSRGRSLWALLGLDKRDRVVALRVVEDLEDDRAVAFATCGGLVKRTRLAEFSNPRPGGVIGMRMRPGDRLLDAQTTTGDTEFALATATGRVIRFPEREAPLVGRPTQGVRGIALRGDDRVAGLVVAKRSATVLMVTRAGSALRTALEDFAVTRRGGLGAATTVTGSEDRVVRAIESLEEDRIALTTAYGVVHGVAASDVERTHRRGALRSVVSLELGDAVVGATRLVGDAPAPGSDSGLPLGGAPR